MIIATAANTRETPTEEIRSVACAPRDSAHSAESAQSESNFNRKLGTSGGSPRYIANNSSAFPLVEGSHSWSDKRKYKWRNRAFLWECSSLKRVRYCGRFPTETNGRIELQLTDEQRAQLVGLQSCGSVWVCPVCNARVMSLRSLEIAAALQLHEQAGGRVAFMTFTLRHARKDSLTALWEAVSHAWGRVTSGRGWVAQKHQVSGWVRVIEVTFGRNGWHVHIHTVMLLNPETSEGDFRRLHSGMVSRWIAAAEAKGFTPTTVGQHGVLSDASAALSAYLTKSSAGWGLAAELTQSQAKIANNSTVPHWQLLEQAQNGLDGALTRWYEFEQVSKGKRLISWSRGLKKRLGLLDVSDDEIAAWDPSGFYICTLTPAGWERVRDMRLAPDLLTAVERGKGFEFLDYYGVDYWRFNHG